MIILNAHGWELEGITNFVHCWQKYKIFFPLYKTDGQFHSCSRFPFSFGFGQGLIGDLAWPWTHSYPWLPNGGNSGMSPHLDSDWQLLVMLNVYIPNIGCNYFTCTHVNTWKLMSKHKWLWSFTQFPIRTPLNAINQWPASCIGCDNRTPWGKTKEWIVWRRQWHRLT